jgi:Raf kinase inhibitor-like YbhB/YbcL family protein
MLAPALLAVAFTLTSPEIHPGGPIGDIHAWNRDGCTGRNVAPALQWRGEPPKTQSYALVVFDPDAPTGHGWYHWVVVDIPERVHALTPAALPAGAREGSNDFGAAGYGGPCPPPGSRHHYVFTLYALDEPRLPGDAVPSGEQIAGALRGHVLGKATLTGTYGR